MASSCTRLAGGVLGVAAGGGEIDPGGAFAILVKLGARGLLGARTRLARSTLSLKHHGPHEIANDAGCNDAERYAYRDF